MMTDLDLDTEPYYHGPVALTCKKCGHQREHPPFESHINLGGQTNAHCHRCRRVHPHRISVPGRNPEMLETARERTPRS